MKIKIEKLIYEGFGLGHDENGQAIFVKKSVPSDILEVEIIKEKKNFAEAKIIEITQSSDLRIAPKCPHFNKCGGCDFQNINYAEQLKFKEEYFKETLERQKIATEVLPIIPSRAEFFYRNTIAFKFIGEAGQKSLAMYDYLDYKHLIPIGSCLLQSETAIQIMKLVVEWGNKFENNLYQLRLREGKKTNEYMVEIFTVNNILNGQNELKNLLAGIEGIKSIYHCQKSQNETKRRLIFGTTTISEKVGKYTFAISPESFFQTNGANVEVLYDKIKEFAGVKMGDRVLDLFCGTGTIGIYLSTMAKEVVGVEINQQAINDAKTNAKINKIPNIEFIQSDATKWFSNYCSSVSENFEGESSRQDSNYSIFNTIIVDPPRAGLTNELIESISKLLAPNSQLIYVSCDPATFARDIIEFEKLGHKLKKVQPLDMFPQTYHLECIGLIK